MNVENLKGLFPKTEKEIRRNFKTIEGEIRNSSEYLDNILFPRESCTSLSVAIENHFKQFLPANYRNRYAGGQYLNTLEKIQYQLVSLAHKGNTKNLDKRSLDWLTMGMIEPAERWARYFGSVAEMVAALVQSVYIRNNIECSELITTGTLTTTDGEVLDIPFDSIDRTDQASGIVFHTEHPMFASNGSVNNDFDILAMFESIKEARTTAGGRAPVKAIMNPVTWQGFWKNEDLNRFFQGFQNPAYFLKWREQDESIQLPAGIQPVIYDKTYYLENPEASVKGKTPGVPVKYIPDHVIVFVPGRVGTRFVGPNDNIKNPSPNIFVDTWESPDGKTLTTEVGEASLPIPDDLNSLHIAYVKDR